MAHVVFDVATWVFSFGLAWASIRLKRACDNRVRGADALVTEALRTNDELIDANRALIANNRRLIAKVYEYEARELARVRR